MSESQNQIENERESEKFISYHSLSLFTLT